MRILVDENIPRMTVDRLRELGHDVLDIRGAPEQGSEDPDLWNTAQTGGRILVTTDRGFTEYRAVPRGGIVIVRLRQPNRKKIHLAIMRAVNDFRNKNGLVFSLSCGTRRSVCPGPGAMLSDLENHAGGVSVRS